MGALEILFIIIIIIIYTGTDCIISKQLQQ